MQLPLASRPETSLLHGPFIAIPCCGGSKAGSLCVVVFVQFAGSGGGIMVFTNLVDESVTGKLAIASKK